MKSKKFLITGGTGYVGRRLAEKLQAGGADVHLLLRKNSDEKKLGKLCETSTVYRWDGDTRQLIEILKKIQPDLVFHLAGKVIVEHQSEEIDELIQSNIHFGVQLLEAMAQSGTKYLVNTGTYWDRFHGSDYNPVNLYAATKKAFEDILRFYSEAHGLRFVTLKLYDVYGPQDPRGKIFNLLEQAMTSKIPVALTPGEQRLDLVYIDDVVEAFCRAAEILEKSSAGELKECYAVSSGRHISLKQVVQTFERIAGQSVPVIWGGKPYRVREVMIPWKGESLPGWKARIDLEAGLGRILAGKTEKAELKA